MSSQTIGPFARGGAAGFRSVLATLSVMVTAFPPAAVRLRSYHGPRAARQGDRAFICTRNRSATPSASSLSILSSTSLQALSTGPQGSPQDRIAASRNSAPKGINLDIVSHVGDLVPMQRTGMELTGMPAELAAKRHFQLILIKPSHYDDDGYVIQWFRSVMPSNSLAALYGLAVDAARASGAWARRRDRRHADRRDQHTHPAEEDHSPACRATAASAWSAWSACSRTSFRAPGHRPAAARRRRAGGHRRLPCLRLPVDAARHPARPAGRDRSGHQPVRRRSRGAPRRAAARCRQRRTQADLQLPQRPARHPRRADAVPAAPSMSAAPPATTRPSTPAAAVPTSARSAPSSTCRAASRAAARPTTSSASSARTGPRASAASSSPTTISPATRTGRSSSTASSS